MMKVDHIQCSFCDPELPDGSIPGCERPATKRIRVTMLGSVTILNVCEHHYADMPEECKPALFSEGVVSHISNPDFACRELMTYVSVQKKLEYSCKGCGAVLVFKGTNDALAIVLEAVGLDAMVIKDHLDRCPWRRKA